MTLEANSDHEVPQEVPPEVHSDSDSDRNPAMPERVQWEYHTRQGWWRACWRQAAIERTWRAWNRRGCPKNALCGVIYKGVIYNIDFKKFKQTSHERNDDGSMKPPRSTRSIRRIVVTHERDATRPYE